MSQRATLAQLPASMQRQAREQLKRVPRSAKHSKYRNQPIIINGERFRSKLEARYFGELKLRQAAGDVLWFLREVPFRLPGNLKYYLDYLVVLASGGVDLVDTKGFWTRVSINKIKQVEEIYGVKIQLWPQRI